MNGIDHVYRSNYVPGRGYVRGVAHVANCPACEWARPFHTFEAAVATLAEHARSAGASHDDLLVDLEVAGSPLFRDWSGQVA